MPNPIVDIAQQQKQQIQQREQQLTNTLTSAYVQVLARLDNSIEALNQEILRLTQNNETISSSKLFRLSRYVSLQTQIYEELQKFIGFSDLTIRSSIPELVTTANNDSFILVREQFNSLAGRKALTSAWDFLNVDQIEQAVSLLTNQSPFNIEYSSTLGEGIADRIEQQIIQSVIIGNNPRTTARLIRQELGLALSRTLNTARTAQIYSYRTAAHLNYRNNSDIVGSWTWFAALDPRTCASCWAKHGSNYPLDQILNDHHQGRCVAIPNIKDGERYGLQPLEIEDGETVFNRLTETQQLEILGETKLDLYRRNQFRFADLSHPYENNIYGTMVREATIGELLRNE